MTMQQGQVVVLRDGEGNYYLIGQDALQAAKVPSDKKQVLQQALQQEDTAGFFLDANFQRNFVVANQSNQASGANIMGGFLVAGNSQALTQVQGNILTVGGGQRA